MSKFKLARVKIFEYQVLNTICDSVCVYLYFSLIFSSSLYIRIPKIYQKTKGITYGVPILLLKYNFWGVKVLYDKSDLCFMVIGDKACVYMNV